ACFRRISAPSRRFVAEFSKVIGGKNSGRSCRRRMGFLREESGRQPRSCPKPRASRSLAPSPRSGGAGAEAKRGEAKLPSHVRPPRMLKNAIVLQVAALRHQGDALALADAIQQKHFPSFVLTPATDAYYRVQVGPYSSQAAAEKARRELDHQGFKSIIKR